MAKSRMPINVEFLNKLKAISGVEQIWELATYLSLYEIESRRLRHNVEALLLRVFINQTHNSNIGHFT